MSSISVRGRYQRHNQARLLNAGADCNNVAFLDEETDWITLNDEKICRAIADFNAKLLVIDPVQAYLGETDIASAAAMRKMLRQLAAWAAMYDCAVVLIGHLNKKQGSKDLYRGLGSIDLVPQPEVFCILSGFQKMRTLQ